MATPHFSKRMIDVPKLYSFNWNDIHLHFLQVLIFIVFSCLCPTPPLCSVWAGRGSVGGTAPRGGAPTWRQEHGDLRVQAAQTSLPGSHLGPSRALLSIFICHLLQAIPYEWSWCSHYMTSRSTPSTLKGRIFPVEQAHQGPLQRKSSQPFWTSSSSFVTIFKSSSHRYGPGAVCIIYPIPALSILPYFGKRKQVTKVTFLVKEQNMSVISTDINGISWCLT